MSLEYLGYLRLYTNNKQQDDINFDFTMPLIIHLALSVSQPASRTHKVIAILEHIHDCYMLCTSDVNG